MADRVTSCTLHAIRSLQLLREQLERHDHDNDMVRVLQTMSSYAREAALEDVLPAVLRHGVSIACLAIVRRQVSHSHIDELLQDLKLHL